MRWRRRHQTIMCIVCYHLIVILWMLFPGCESSTFTSNTFENISLAVTTSSFTKDDKTSPSLSTPTNIHEQKRSHVSNNSSFNLIDAENLESFKIEETAKSLIPSSSANDTEHDISVNSDIFIPQEQLYENNDSNSEIKSVHKKHLAFENTSYARSESFNSSSENMKLIKGNNNDSNIAVNTNEDYQRLELNNASVPLFHLVKDSFNLFEKGNESDVLSGNRSYFFSSKISPHVKYDPQKASQLLKLPLAAEESSDDVSQMQKKDEALNTESVLDEFNQKFETEMPDDDINIEDNSRVHPSSISVEHGLISVRSSNDTHFPMDNSSADIDSIFINSSSEEATTNHFSSAIIDVSTVFTHTTEMLSVVTINGTTDPTVESIKKEDILGIGAIIGIIFGVLGVVILVGGVFGYLIYHRRFRPLSDIKYPTDNCAYVDDSLRVSYINNHIELPKDNSEEMFSLDNDSFLNSLEAMTLQNYWAEDAKNTKV